jgi:hypothetical protein
MEEKEIPTYQQLKDKVAVVIDEYLDRVRDVLDNGNREEISKVMEVAKNLSSFPYALDPFNPNKEVDYLDRADLEKIVDAAVEKVHEKMQGEERNAVARKLKGMVRPEPTGEATDAAV